MNKKAVSDILKVTFSNIIKLFSGVLVGFILPKIIGVTDYGYYKSFTLYATYAGLFHFGINDGIYLCYGGKDYDSLDKMRFRAYFKILFLVELLVACIILFVAVIGFTGENRFIAVCLSGFLIFNNVTGYYQYISQATQRFSELSTRNIVQSILISLAVIVCAILYKSGCVLMTYRIYTVIYISIFFFLSAWYVYTYRDISFKGETNYNGSCKEIIGFIKIGLPLMIANLCSTLVLNLDRQFVNSLFDTKEYAIYAFAYNLLSLVTTATTAVSIVLYPNLKRMNQDSLRLNYDRFIRIVLLIVFGGLCLFFPLSYFVRWFLPQYSSSLPIFRIIFPGLAISSAITIVMHNYYKTIGKNMVFFFQSAIIIVVSIIANIFAYYRFRTTSAISWASIITMFLWYLICNSYFVKKYSIPWKKSFSYMVTMVILFYMISFLFNNWVGLFIYGFIFLFISYFMFREILLKKTL